MIQQLINLFNSHSSINDSMGTEAEINNLQKEAGKLIKEKRESKGLSRASLGMRTRITPSVIEAIENGWSHKFPEKAYLTSMIPKLENELGLEKNKLKNLLEDSINYKQNHKRKSKRRNYINLLGTWHGDLLFFMVIFISIFSINQQQQKLISLNSISYKPISPSYSSDEIKSELQSNIKYEGEINSDLIKNGNWLEIIQRKLRFKRDFGWLEINLKENHNIDIKDRSGYQILIEDSIGLIRLKLSPPILLKVNPPATAEDLIIWNGIKFIPKENNNGIYHFQNADNEEAPSPRDLPQNLPLSP